jgi:hypothetical protein
MSWFVSVVIAVVAVPSLLAQTTAPAPPVGAGLESPEAARGIVNGVLQEDDQLRPVLSRLDPQAWYEKKGAPSTYVVQWQTAQREITDLDAASRLFLQNIEDLPAALDLYFRLEAIDLSARSLDQGAERYADRAQADQLGQFVARNFDARQRFRDYVRELAADVEQNFKIADGEAQRCRAAQAKAPAPCPAATRKRG